MRATSRTRRDAAVGAGLHDDVCELLGLEQPAERVHRELEGVAGGHRRLADDARRRPACSARAAPRTTSPVVRLQLREPLGVEPDAHAVLAQPEERDVADAVDAREHVAHLDERVVADVELVVAAGRARAGARPSGGRATT